jgi:transcriptional regulator with XRE-family HTH domain
MNEVKNMKEMDVLDLLEEQYNEADNQKEIDYWTPLSSLIMESVNLRGTKKISQADLAKAMKTRQSVISRFENMGRLPSYEFITRMSQAFGHAPGMTLFGDFMATVPLEKQKAVKDAAEKAGKSTQTFVNSLMSKALEDLDSDDFYEDEMDFNESIGSIVLFPGLKVQKNKGSEKCQDSLAI